MFTRFTNPEGKGVWVRSSSVRALAEEDGAVRLFLGYGLQTDVVESAEAVLSVFGASADPD